MSSWEKDLGPYLLDETHIVISTLDYTSLDKYDSTVPTSPSPGRVYRREIRDGKLGFGPNILERIVYFVQDDPEKPGWQIHKPYLALLI